MSKVRKRLVLGLTGGIASGKSTVLQVAKRLGVPTLDADQIARAVIRPGLPAHRAIVRAFGESILRKDRSIDRSALGKIVFASPAKRRKLERIVHPAVIRELKLRIARNRRGLIVVDIPLLYEAKLQRLVDHVLVVWAPPAIQMRRMMRRNGLSGSDARSRLAAQWPVDKKKKLADFVIDNSGSLASTRRQARELFRRLTAAN